MPDDLEREVRDLALRVAALEQLVGHALACPEQPKVGQAVAPATLHPLPETTALLPVLGRALLGLAGAYLLRALTESGTFAPQAGVAIGLIYALLWLVWAARTPAALRIETALRSLTSVLVLAPLLWEATLRFHAISTWTAGAILLLFTFVSRAPPPALEPPPCLDHWLSERWLAATTADLSVLLATWLVTNARG